MQAKTLLTVGSDVPPSQLISGGQGWHPQPLTADPDPPASLLPSALYGGGLCLGSAGGRSRDPRPSPSLCCVSPPMMVKGCTHLRPEFSDGQGFSSLVPDPDWYPLWTERVSSLPCFCPSQVLGARRASAHPSLAQEHIWACRLRAAQPHCLHYRNAPVCGFALTLGLPRLDLNTGGLAVSLSDLAVVSRSSLLRVLNLVLIHPHPSPHPPPA